MWPTRITLWPHGLLYIERRFCKLYHPRIVHLCNVLEVSPSKWLISKVLISLFFYFWSWLHKIWYQRWKQELDSYGIDQFQSISSSGRTYPLKILHGRMRILYRSIQNYSSIEDNTFLKERGMLGPYITSIVPYCC